MGVSWGVGVAPEQERGSKASLDSPFFLGCWTDQARPDRLQRTLLSMSRKPDPFLRASKAQISAKIASRINGLLIFVSARALYMRTRVRARMTDPLGGAGSLL